MAPPRRSEFPAAWKSGTRLGLSMLPTNANKPEIIVVALDIDPRKGSEPGKGWWWSNALSPFFRLHIITQSDSIEACTSEPSVREAGWRFYPTHRGITTWKFPTGYRQYAAWLDEALQISAQIFRAHPLAGLCHVTLGSFRVLPKYETLGIPYVIGPLGGGECSPMSLLWPRPIPFVHKLAETLRPILNNSFALVPQLRKTLGASRLVLATSRESADVIDRMGAHKTAVVFPDAYDRPVPPETALAERTGQAEEVRKEIRLLWQGRPLWWKGPDIALSLMQFAQAAGLRVRLTMVSDWSGSFGTQIETLIRRLGIGDVVDLRPPTAREEFLGMLGAHHAFLATSLHDSGGIPLLEAEALGLPCFTLGLGGNREAACPKAGVSHVREGLQSFLSDALERMRTWQLNPETWLADAKAAIDFAGGFSNTKLEACVANLIGPALNSPRRSEP